MSLDVWFQQDIQNTLLALHSAQAAQPARRETLDNGAGRECEAAVAGHDRGGVARRPAHCRVASLRMLAQHRVLREFAL